MSEWEEITFKNVKGKGFFKFSYLINRTYNGNSSWAECIENEEEKDIFAQELLINLQSNKHISNLRAYKSIAEYE